MLNCLLRFGLATIDVLSFAKKKKKKKKKEKKRKIRLVCYGKISFGSC
jgi:hypothetical protein